jgi:hypothetical protein
VVGEIGNSGVSSVELVRVFANLLNSQGNLLATNGSFALERVLVPGNKSCFDVIFLNPPPSEQIAEITFESTYFAGGERPPGLVITSASGSYITSSTFQIIGQVQNTSTDRINNVFVSGTLYSGESYSGIVLRCAGNFVNLMHLDPGQTSSFTITYIGLPAGAVGSLIVEVEGRPPD